MIQKLSFDFGDAYFEFGRLRFAFRLTTSHNVYGPLAEQVSLHSSEGRLHVVAEALQYGGAQYTCPGQLTAEIWQQGQDLKFKVNARHQEGIKGITVLIKGLAAPVDKEEIYYWPHIWLDRPSFPLIEAIGGQTVAILPDKARRRHRRWATYREYSGDWVFNLSEDEEYTRQQGEMEGSIWSVTYDPKPEHVEDRWFELVERDLGLEPWATRPDVPAWLNDVCLVLNMHCEGWTGHVFNTFQRQLEILQWIAQHIDGHRVLVYLPGWDGRYYWNYPLYNPSPACGGPEAFHTLVQGAHELGMHVIPMFGMIASSYQNTRELGLEHTACQIAEGVDQVCDWTEWDEDLGNELTWQPLSLGAPDFRKHLFERICWVSDTFDTDGAMLDISGWTPKDPRYDILEGIRLLTRDLHSRYSDYLIMGENGCELQMPYFPLFHHVAGVSNPDVPPEHYSKGIEPDHPFFRYCRSAYHLNLGAPGRGSTGVHELGTNPYVRPSADSRVIPTLAIVEDTLPFHSQEVQAVIEVAAEWAKRWLA